MIKAIPKTKEVVEDIANMVMEDLKDAGYRAELVKHKKKFSSWKIEPIDDLDGIQLEEFQKIKKEKQEEYVNYQRETLKEIRKGFI